MRKVTLTIALGLAIFASYSSNAQRITETVAGNGMAGFSGDNDMAKGAELNGPKDVCLDAANNIYFVDRANARIRKVAARNGVITTVAGGGTSLADGVPATTALLDPNYMCISAAGNIYFTTGNQVRMIDAATGNITTIAGGASAGFGGDGGLATAAVLNYPQGICIDASNNLYIVDRGNNRVRKITAATGIISTIAGGTSAGLSGDGGPATAALLQGPVCICITPSGDIYFSDQNPNYPSYDNSIIRMISASTGIINTVAGSISGGTGVYGLPALYCTLGTITGLCSDDSGGVYSDEMSCSCRMMNLSKSDTLYLVGGNFYSQAYTDDIESALSDMNTPYGLCVDHNGDVYIADSANERIRKMTHISHTPTFAFGKGAYLDAVLGTTYDLDGLMWITDADSGQTETWTVLDAPLHGVLGGLPATAMSGGVITTSKPSGLTYAPLPGYAEADIFRIRVSDGVLSDTITVYVGVNSGDLSVASAPSVGSDVKLFPNPATSQLNIKWSNIEPKETGIVVTDMAGRICYSTTVNSGSGTLQVNTASLPAGVYMMKMDGVAMKKFVKE